jgi:cytochrome c oxidase subunit 1
MNPSSPTGHAVPHADDDAGHPAPQSFLARYVWSQDHKVIAIQYA